MENEYFLFGSFFDRKFGESEMGFSEGSNLPVFFNVDSDLNGPGNVISGFESWTGDITGTSALYSSKLAEDESMLSGNTVIKAANTKITELTTPSQRTSPKV